LRKISHLPLYDLHSNALKNIADIPGVLAPSTGA